jgi:hypothetical protein
LGLFLASAPWFEYPRKLGVMGDEKLFFCQTYQNRVNFVLALEEHSIVSTKTSRIAVLSAVTAVRKDCVFLIRS